MCLDGGGVGKGVWRQLWWDELWGYASFPVAHAKNSFRLLPKREGLSESANRRTIEDS